MPGQLTENSPDKSLPPACTGRPAQPIIGHEGIHGPARSRRSAAHPHGRRHRPGGQADRDRGRHRAAADPVPERPRDRHDDDDRRSSRLSRRRLSAQSEHAARRRPDHRRSTTTTSSRPWSCAPSRETDFEDKLRKKTLTSGCAQGTVFGDLMEKFDEIRLDPRRGAARPRGSTR